MSPRTTVTRGGRVRTVRYRAVQWPMVLWLTLVWCVLWGTFSGLTIVGGALAGILVSYVFPLPPLHMRVRVRPWAMVVLVARFALDVIVASIEVSKTTLLPPAELRNAMVRVPLRTESDIVMTAVAELVSLVPGSVVVEAHRSTHTLFLHVLDVRSEADLDRARERVWAQEERVVRAFGAESTPGEPAPEGAIS